jgi:hypothetical protein
VYPNGAQPSTGLQRTQIVRHVAELSDQLGVAEIAGGRITGAAECDRADMAYINVVLLVAYRGRERDRFREGR